MTPLATLAYALAVALLAICCLALALFGYREGEGALALLGIGLAAVPALLTLRHLLWLHEWVAGRLYSSRIG